MTTANRTYVQRRRAVAAAETRTRILAAAHELIPEAENSLGVDEIARHAGVAVQTIYDHFGSKGGLLVAVVQDVQRSAGLVEAIEGVFRSPDGESALQKMIAATLSLWHRAWPYIEFILRSRRVDPVVGRENAVLDTLRHAHLWAICRQIQDEGRLRSRRSAVWGADQVFALTTATVYEELVVRRGWSLNAATDSITKAAMAAVLKPETTAVRSPAPDWAAHESAAAARATRAGADARRFPGAWRRAAGRGPS
ncbi:MAG: TetR/AcrR family transcriptional regulator [Chloroflexota bacterium]